MSAGGDSEEGKEKRLKDGAWSVGKGGAAEKAGGEGGFCGLICKSEGNKHAEKAEAGIKNLWSSNDLGQV